MPALKKLLVVYHSETGTTQKLAEAVMKGIKQQSCSNVITSVEDPLSVDFKKVLETDAIILGTSENFGYMSGALKHFFDSIYYPCLGKKQGLAYGLFIKAGTDGSGALSSVKRIINGLAWREVIEPKIIVGKVSRDDLIQCKEFGATIAAGLDAGLF